MNRLYRMSNREYRGLLNTASDCAPMGIYAVEKNGYAELRCDRCKSTTELKKRMRELRAQGFKVYVNGK